MLSKSIEQLKDLKHFLLNSEANCICRKKWPIIINGMKNLKKDNAESSWKSKINAVARHLDPTVAPIKNLSLLYL